MRLMELLTSRAGLPVRYSRGHNPRPQLSLPAPRPTGASSRDERLVLKLDAPVEPDAMLRALQDVAPEGMRFHSAGPLAGRRAPQVERMDYQLGIEPDRRGRIAQRIDALRDRPSWTVTRRRGPRGPAAELDIRPMVRSVELREGRLQFSLVPCGQKWARPLELLDLLGLDPADAARLERTTLKFAG
jgi:radical SAM-linked protein